MKTWIGSDFHWFQGNWMEHELCLELLKGKEVV